MVTIQTSIQLYDNMTPGLKGITSALNTVISTMESVQSGSQKIFDTAGLQAARDGLVQANSMFMQIGNGIRQAGIEQENFTKNMQQRQSETKGILDKIMTYKRILPEIGDKVGKVMNLSDELSQTSARLNMIVDDGGSVKELENKIFQSAQRSRGSYLATADAVATMSLRAGDVFTSNDETIAFVELLNKQFTIAGTSQEEIASATLQLTQALGSGVLRGEEFNAVFDSAPNIMQTIADYMGVPIGQLRNMAAEGLITSEIIKNAMFASTEEINQQFEDMPMTFGQVWISLQNILLNTFQPILNLIGRLANLLGDNMDVVVAAFYALATAVGIYTVAQWIATGAAKAFFTTLLANPLTWILMGVTALIYVFYRWIQSIGGLQIAFLRAKDVILTAFAYIRYGILYAIIAVMNWLDNWGLKFQTICVSIANFVGDMKVKVLMILQNLINKSINMINKFIDLLNKIPGVEIEAISHVTFGTNQALENQIEKDQRELELNLAQEKFFEEKTKRGAMLVSSFSSLHAGHQSRLQEINALRQEIGQGDGQVYDSSAYGASDTLGAISDGVGQTAENTALMANTMEMSDENLKFLREMAEQQAINKFTTAEIRVEMTNNNQINSEQDVDGLINTFALKVQEAMVASAEGVHV